MAVELRLSGKGFGWINLRQLYCLAFFAALLLPFPPLYDCFGAQAR
jgi:hypothetical protein